MQTHWRLAKNAVANLIRGGAAGLVALFLPAVLVRHMSPVDYAVWVLVLQVVAYLSYLNFGLQVAVGRFVAVAREKRDIDLGRAVFSAAVAGLVLAGVLGLTLTAIASAALHHIFPGVPLSMIPTMRVAMLIVGFSAVTGLVASAWSGAFIGLQRNEIIALTFGGAKLVSAFALAVAAIAGASIVLMATMMAAVEVISFLGQYAFLRRLAPEIAFDPRTIKAPVVRELASYCLSLTVWSFAMLLVTGFDLTLVGRFEFIAVTPYATSAALVAFLAGTQNAIFGAMMPHAASLHARQDPVGLGKLLLNCTRLSTMLLTLSGLPLLLYAGPVIKLWIGARYVSSGKAILILLVLGNVLRCTAVPYATILIATAQQKLIIMTPLIEGIVNLVASIILGRAFGAVGVAVGTLIGVIIAVLANFFYNMPRTAGTIQIGRGSVLLHGILLPLLPALPLLLLFLIGERQRFGGLAICAFGLTVLLDVAVLDPRQLLRAMKA